MTVTFSPSRGTGVAIAPPSKSVTHRALIAASLAQGVSILENVALSADIQATINCLRALGAQVEWHDHVVTATGLFLDDIPDGLQLPCDESGTTLRFLIPLVLLTGKEITFTGSPRLLSRPLSVYERICKRQDLLFLRRDGSLTVRGVLSPGKYTVPGYISSQFVSALCMALPLLDGDSWVELLPPVESRPYVDMTVKTLALFGVEAIQRDGLVTIPGQQRYRPYSMAIEGDWSNAAFLAGLNLLGGSVRVDGLPAESYQGDQIFPRFFDALRQDAPTLDLADCPDLGPVCFALAAALHGATFTGIRRLRYKESDRISAMMEELSKFGAQLQLDEDVLTVLPSPLHAPVRPLVSHRDHRVAMALSLLASHTGGTLHGAEAVDKSFPDFYDQLARLGIHFTRDF